MYLSFFLGTIGNHKDSNTTIAFNSRIARLLCCVLFMLIAWKGTSQEQFLKQFSFAEGLPTNTVYSVYQDSKGYIWFATDLGVCRYGGKEIEHYMPDDGVPDIEIFGFYEDQQNRLWLRTLDGSLGYYREGKFYNEQIDSLLVLDSLRAMTSSIQEYGGSLYISFLRNKILKLDSTNTIIEEITVPYRINNLMIHENEFFFFDYKSIDVFDLKTLDKKRSIPIKGNLDIFRSVFYKNQLLFTNDKSLISLDLEKNKLSVVDSFSGEIIAIHIIDSLVWIGTRDGVYLVEIDSNAKMTIISSLLKGKMVAAVCKDFEGGFWFSTLNNGVFYGYGEGLNVVYNTHYNSIISTINIDPKKRSWIGFSNNQYRTGYFPDMEENCLSEREMNRLHRFCFVGNEVWGMGGGLLRKVDDQKNSIYFRYAVKDLVLDDENNYVLACDRYLIKISREEMHKYSIEILNSKLKKLPDSIVVLKGRMNCLYKNKKDQIWVGANRGLFQLIGDTTVELKYQNESLVAISDFCEYSDSSFIVTTKKQGAFIVTNNRITTNLSIKDGLNSPSCFKCEKGKGNQIFILTSNGLNQLIQSSNGRTISNLSFNLGIEKERIMDITMLDDTLLIALPHRVLSYIPRNNSIVIPPKLIINSIKVNGEFYNKEHLNLSSKQRNITISFTGISYKNSQTITYQYQLVGASNEWISTTNRIIQFEALAPGSYLFKLKAISGIGVESQTIEIPFYIEIPLYKKDWFTVLAIILTIGGTWYLIKRRINRLEQRLLIKEQMILAVKRKGELEGELREIEQQALRLQMNPHFIFNALNTIKGYYSSKDIQKANTYISKFSKLLRIMLEHKERTISLSKEKELLDLYLKLVMLRYDTEFVFSFKIDETINPNEVVIPSMLFQPFIENSIIHGISTMLKDGKIEIIIRRKKDQLHCVIRDNGIGRKAAKKKTFGKSNRVNALDIIKRRLELIEKESGGETAIVINDLYENENEKATGTEVLLTLPYKEQW